MDIASVSETLSRCRGSLNLHFTCRATKVDSCGCKSKGKQLSNYLYKHFGAKFMGSVICLGLTECKIISKCPFFYVVYELDLFS